MLLDVSAPFSESEKPPPIPYNTQAVRKLAGMRSDAAFSHSAASSSPEFITRLFCFPSMAILYAAPALTAAGLWFNSRTNAAKPS